MKKRSENSKKNLYALIVLCLTTIPAGIWKAFLYFDQRASVKNKEEGIFSRNLEGIKTLYSALNNILASTSAKKVMLMKVENSGSIPKPGVQLYSSVVYEVYDERSTMSTNRWQKRTIDADYLDMLIRLSSSGHVVNRINELKDNTLLKDIYLAGNVSLGHVYEISQEPHYYFYMTIVFEDNHILNVKERVEIAMTLDQIKSIFKKEKSLINLIKRN